MVKNVRMSVMQLGTASVGPWTNPESSILPYKCQLLNLILEPAKKLHETTVSS